MSSFYSSPRNRRMFSGTAAPKKPIKATSAPTPSPAPTASSLKSAMQNAPKPPSATAAASKTMASQQQVAAPQVISSTTKPSTAKPRFGGGSFGSFGGNLRSRFDREMSNRRSLESSAAKPRQPIMGSVGATKEQIGQANLGNFSAGETVAGGGKLIGRHTPPPVSGLTPMGTTAEALGAGPLADTSADLQMAQKQKMAEDIKWAQPKVTLPGTQEEITAPEPGSVEDYETRGNQMWEDLMATHEGSLDDALKGVGARTAAEQRRAAEMSEGSSLGGGFGAGQAQASLSGQELEWQARTQHAQQGLDLQMTQLENLYSKAEAEKDRQAQEHIQSMMNNVMMEQEMLRQGVAAPVFDEEGNVVSISGKEEEAPESQYGLPPVDATDPTTEANPDLVVATGGYSSGDITGALGHASKDAASYMQLLDRAGSAVDKSPAAQEALSFLKNGVQNWEPQQAAAAIGYSYLYYNSTGRWPSPPEIINGVQAAGLGPGGGQIQHGR